MAAAEAVIYDAGHALRATERELLVLRPTER
jgi:hypothetical protein